MHIIKSSKKGGRGGGCKFGSWYSSLEDKWVSLLVLLSRDDHHWWGDNRIATSIKFDNISLQWPQKKQPKSVLHIQNFCFAYVHVSVVTVVPLALLVATQKLWKTCNKIDIRTYPRKGSFMNLFHSTIILYLIVYPIKWSVCGRTNKDLADKSQALQSVAALSRACRSSPVI